MAANRRQLPGPIWGLSAKLIATIVVVILAVEVVVYLPSAANFRTGWLEDRLRVGMVAARVLDAAPNIMDLPQSLTDRLLMSAGATAIVYRREGQSQLIELKDVPMPREAVTVDLREAGPMAQIAGALDTLVFGGERALAAFGLPVAEAGHVDAQHRKSGRHEIAGKGRLQPACALGEFVPA